MLKSTITSSQREVIKEVRDRIQGGSGFADMVMFDLPKGKTFGLVGHYCKEAFEQAKNGRVIVYDLIRPYSRGPYTVKAEQLVATDLKWGHNTERGSLPRLLEFMQWGECPVNDYCSLEGLAHQIRAEKNDGLAVRVNDFFQIGVADGCALYVVVALHGSKCDVEWRGFWNHDRYIDHHYGWGRKNCDLTDIERYVCGRKTIDQVLSVDLPEPQIDRSAAFKILAKEYEENFEFPAPVEV